MQFSLILSFPQQSLGTGSYPCSSESTLPWGFHFLSEGYLGKDVQAVEGRISVALPWRMLPVSLHRGHLSLWASGGSSLQDLSAVKSGREGFSALSGKYLLAVFCCGFSLQPFSSGPARQSLLSFYSHSTLCLCPPCTLLLISCDCVPACSAGYCPLAASGGFPTGAILSGAYPRVISLVECFFFALW